MKLNVSHQSRKTNRKGFSVSPQLSYPRSNGKYHSHQDYVFHHQVRNKLNYMRELSYYFRYSLCTKAWEMNFMEEAAMWSWSLQYRVCQV